MENNETMVQEVVTEVSKGLTVGECGVIAGVAVIAVGVWELGKFSYKKIKGVIAYKKQAKKPEEDIEIVE